MTCVKTEPKSVTFDDLVKYKSDWKLHLACETTVEKINQLSGCTSLPHAGLLEGDEAEHESPSRPVCHSHTGICLSLPAVQTCKIWRLAERAMTMTSKVGIATPTATSCELPARLFPSACSGIAWKPHTVNTAGFLEVLECRRVSHQRHRLSTTKHTLAYKYIR